MHFAAMLQVARIQGKRVLGLVPLLLLCSCSSMSNTDRGILGGAGIGAVTGAIVGGAVKNPGAGAAIGAAVGGVSGGLVGNAIDKSEQKQAQLAAAAPRGPLGLTDVASMAQQHISDDIIISQIRTTGSVYNLSASDIVWLKQNGVSDVVVREMQMTVARPGRRVYSAVPVYGYEPVYVETVPPPVVGIGFGIGYGHPHHPRW
jgi:uncharacterized protein YcfJ